MEIDRPSQVRSFRIAPQLEDIVCPCSGRKERLNDVRAQIGNVALHHGVPVAGGLDLVFFQAGTKTDSLL